MAETYLSKSPSLPPDLSTIPVNSSFDPPTALMAEQTTCSNCHSPPSDDTIFCFCHFCTQYTCMRCVWPQKFEIVMG